MTQEQPKPEPKAEAQAEAKNTTDAKPQDMETEANGDAPENSAEPVVEDPMEQ